MKNAYCYKHNKTTLILRYKSYVKKDLIESIRLSHLFVTQLNKFLICRVSSSIPQKNESCEKVLNCLSLNQSQKYQTRYYNSRVFVDLAAALAKTLCNSSHQKIKQTTSRFTVIRSPFVFKKTREQFGLKKHVCEIVLNLNQNEQEFLLPLLSQLRLPGELQLISMS